MSPSLLLIKKDHEINSKTISLQIKFNNGYTIPAGSGESFILTGFVGGVTDEYDGITTGMGPKEQFTWYNSSKTTQYTGEGVDRLSCKYYSDEKKININPRWLVLHFILVFYNNLL